MAKFGEGLSLETPAEAEARLVGKSVEQKGELIPDGNEVPSAMVVATETPAALALVAESKAAEDSASADALQARIKNGEVGTKAVESTETVPIGEKGKNENPGVADHGQFNKIKDSLHAEAEVALSQGDTPGFQTAYIKMMENEIARSEATIQALDVAFQSGSFQKNFRETHGATQTNEYIKETYEYQKNAATQHISDLREYSIEQVKRDPKAIIQRDGFDEKPNKIALLRGILKEAGNYLKLEKDAGRPEGEMYPNATTKVEGAVSAALRYKDPETMTFLKDTFAGDLSMTNVKLSSELQKQIADLKV